MTKIIEAQNQLLTFFTQNDELDLTDESQLAQFNFDSKVLDKKKSATLRRAAQALVSTQIVEEIDEDTFVLVNSFGSNGQEVGMSMLTAELMGNILNQYYKSLNNKNLLCDKLAIKEEDIQMLCGIIAELVFKKTSDADERE